VTHPFHPLFNQRLEFVKCRWNWQADRVYVRDSDGLLLSLPVEWAHLVAEDPPKRPESLTCSCWAGTVLLSWDPGKLASNGEVGEHRTLGGFSPMLHGEKVISGESIPDFP